MENEKLKLIVLVFFIALAPCQTYNNTEKICENGK